MLLTDKCKWTRPDKTCYVCVFVKDMDIVKWTDLDHVLLGHFGFNFENFIVFFKFIFILFFFFGKEN